MTAREKIKNIELYSKTTKKKTSFFNSMIKLSALVSCNNVVLTSLKMNELVSILFIHTNSSFLFVTARSVVHKFNLLLFIRVKSSVRRDSQSCVNCFFLTKLTIQIVVSNHSGNNLTRKEALANLTAYSADILIFADFFKKNSLIIETTAWTFHVLIYETKGKGKYWVFYLNCKSKKKNLLEKKPSVA